MRIHLGKGRLGQPEPPLQQVAEIQDRGLVGNTVIARAIPAKRRIASLS